MVTWCHASPLYYCIACSSWSSLERQAGMKQASALIRKALAKPHHQQKNIKTMRVLLVSMLMFMSCPSSLVHKLLMLMMIVACMLALQSSSDNSNPRQLKPRANSNQSRFSMYFLHTFTVILSSVSQTLYNSNIALTRSNFCFPSDHFYTIFLRSKRVISRKKTCTEVRDNEFISKQPSQFFVFTFLSLQCKFSVHPCILCCLIEFPSHHLLFPFLPVTFFKLPIIRTLETPTFFRFP